MNTPIAVLGPGAWGTALAVLLARRGQPTRLWGNDRDQMHALKAERTNSIFLPGIAFPDNLTIYDELSEAMDGVQDVLIVVPSHAFRVVLQTIKSTLSPEAIANLRFAWATKGLDPHSGNLLHHVVAEEISDTCPMAVLSGPSFAKEVAEGMPTAVTLACTTPDFERDLIARLHHETFRIYTGDDLIGVEVGGAVKNVLAIAAGIADGLGFGANARCAMITRGLAEMIQFGIMLGAKQETFMGLSGIGDLILTCTDDQSRNRRFGLAIGRGLSPEAAKDTINQVIEGARNVDEVYHLAQQHHLAMPITEQVYRVLHGELSARDAVNDLLKRDVRAER